MQATRVPLECRLDTCCNVVVHLCIWLTCSYTSTLILFPLCYNLCVRFNFPRILSFLFNLPYSPLTVIVCCQGDGHLCIANVAMQLCVGVCLGRGNDLSETTAFMKSPETETMTNRTSFHFDSFIFHSSLSCSLNSYIIRIPLYPEARHNCSQLSPHIGNSK